jgi:myo-inositol-1(or 4)-monophosphatase
MYQPLLEKVVEIGKELKALAGNIPDIGETKQWLTEQDITTERRLCECIKTIDIDAQFFAEEEHDGVDNPAENSPSLWVIDPISNTFNFIHGLPHYSICVAHTKNGIVVFSAVYDPAMDELFVAEKGKGTFLNNKQVYVSQSTKDLSVLIGPHLVPSNQERNQEVITLIQKFCTIGTIRSIGSLGVQYAYVACGRANAAVSLPHDIFPEIAGKLLVEEAGGMFSDFEGNEISFETRHILATNKLVHEDFLNKLKE